MASKFFLAALLFVLVPFAASALTADEITAQIRALEAQLAGMQTKQVGAATPVSGVGKSCPSLTRVLSRGSRGEDVSALQRYLIGESMLSSDSATGYFGAQTEMAVQRFQQRHNIVSSGLPHTTGYGSVGSRTRGAIRFTCEGLNTFSKDISRSGGGAFYFRAPYIGNQKTYEVSFEVGAGCAFDLDWGDGSAREMRSATACAAASSKETKTYSQNHQPVYDGKGYKIVLKRYDAAGSEYTDTTSIGWNNLTQ